MTTLLEAATPEPGDNEKALVWFLDHLDELDREDKIPVVLFDEFRPLYERAVELAEAYEATRQHVGRNILAWAEHRATHGETHHIVKIQNKAREAANA